MRSFAIPALLSAGLAFSLAAVPAMAQPGPAHFHHGGGPLLEGVTLTDAQRSQVDALIHASHDQNQATFDQLRSVHQQIDAALTGTGSVSEASLQPLLQQQESLEAKLEQARLENQLAIRNLLTPDQLSAAAATHAKLAALREQEHALVGDHDAPPPPPAS